MFHSPQMSNTTNSSRRADASRGEHATQLASRVLGYFFMLFMAVASVTTARAAPDLIAPNNTLPMRNIHIEVKQIQRSESQGSGLQGRGSVVLGGSGGLDLQGQLLANQRQQQQSGSATQQILVINGRAARISLSHRIPLRVVQTFVRNGALVRVSGTLILDAGTGFIATPRWDGSEQVDLELEAFAASGAAHQSNSRASSVLSVPLNTWVSVARSDTESQSQDSNFGGSGQTKEQAESEVQVRLNVR